MHAAIGFSSGTRRLQYKREGIRKQELADVSCATLSQKESTSCTSDAPFAYAGIWLMLKYCERKTLFHGWKVGREIEASLIEFFYGWRAIAIQRVD